MANALASGLSPETVSEFRKAILQLRETPDLHGKLKDRMLAVYGRILPGLDPKGSEVEGANHFMIGPEMQVEAFEKYLKMVEGDDVTLYRIYPRDFWVIAGN